MTPWRDRDMRGAPRYQGLPPRARPITIPSPRPEPEIDEMVMAIHQEEDLFRARGAAREICARLGFGDVAMTKVVTALSELGRNILQYAGRGSVVIRALPRPARGVEVVARDDGPGIAELERILSPGFQSRTGMGVGLRGARSLMDFFDVQTAPGRGTTVTIRKQVFRR